MKITETRISFTRLTKMAVLESEADSQIKTFFRCTEEALKDIQKVWVVSYNDDIIAVSKAEAKALGYKNVDETLVAVEDNEEYPGFRWVKA
jgi:hypothetical protein